MLNTIEKVFAALVLLLRREASKHSHKANVAVVKASKHNDREVQAIANMKAAGRVHRAKLAVKADIHERHADKASALASRISKVLE